MSRRKEIVVFAGLLVVLAGALYRDIRSDAASVSDAPVAVSVEPLRVPNPILHLNRLIAIRRNDYAGSHRNIFSAKPPPPPPSKRRADAAKALPALPPPPPPLQVPLTYYGTATDPKTGRKLAFFTNGDNVYIVSQGETLLGHFRLLSIGEHSAVFEDLGSGRTATLAMTPPVQP